MSLDSQPVCSAVLALSLFWSSSALPSLTCASPAAGKTNRPRRILVTQNEPLELLQSWYWRLKVWSCSRKVSYQHTMRSVRSMSSSSSFFRFSKWASIRDCSSVRSFSIRFLWMSWNESDRDQNVSSKKKCNCSPEMNLHQSPLFLHLGSLEVPDRARNQAWDGWKIWKYFLFESVILTELCFCLYRCIYKYDQ